MYYQVNRFYTLHIPNPIARRWWTVRTDRCQSWIKKDPDRAFQAKNTDSLEPWSIFQHPISSIYAWFQSDSTILKNLYSTGPPHFRTNGFQGYYSMKHLIYDRECLVTLLACKLFGMEPKGRGHLKNILKLCSFCLLDHGFLSNTHKYRHLSTVHIGQKGCPLCFVI